MTRHFSCGSLANYDLNHPVPEVSGPTNTQPSERPQCFDGFVGFPHPCCLVLRCSLGFILLNLSTTFSFSSFAGKWAEAQWMAMPREPESKSGADRSSKHQLALVASAHFNTAFARVSFCCS